MLVCGAGPTGLVLALWLTRRGVPVRIIDRAAEPGTTSRALAVQVRTLELYRMLGIADALVAEGARIAGLNFWARGRHAARAAVREIGEGLTPYPFILAHPQDAHERLLIRELESRGVPVERGTELTHLEQQASGVRATLERADGSTETCEASWLAGCDGASSTVRHQLGAGFPGGTYSGRFFVADVEASGPVVNGELHAGIDEADFVLVFPIKGHGRVRLVGLVRTAKANDPHAALTFDDVRGRAVEQLRLDITKVNWFSTYNVHHRVADRFRDGRVFLLGDAAHIHSPVGGQGMNTGIGDAVNLGWKLAAVARNESPESLLDTYEPERIGFARQLVATTDRAFTFVTSQGKIAGFVRTRVIPRIVPRLFESRSVRRLIFSRVSQVGIRYRDSALSSGRAGAVHGGDRLPWAPLEGGGDNFEPLQSLDWQVHVYGTPAPGIADACTAHRVALHVFPWQDSMAGAGLTRDAAYLVRPDSYVAIAGADAAALRAFAETEILPG